jgi:hypothetical protein
LLSAGGQLKAIQIYSVARDPAETAVSALAKDELEQIAAAVRAVVPIPVITY